MCCFAVTPIFLDQRTSPRNKRHSEDFPRRVFARKSMDRLALRARYTQSLKILDWYGTLNSYGTSQPMMTGATMTASHPQLIAPASTCDLGPPVLRSTPPTYVIGSQGRRGILPSVPGRPAAPVAAKNTAIPVKDADGRFPCPHCTKTYLHAQHLKRHLLRREFYSSNFLPRPTRRHTNPIAQTLANVRTSVFSAATPFLAVIFSSGISKNAPSDVVIPPELRTCPTLFLSRMA